MRFDSRAAKLLAVGDHIAVEDAPGLRIVRSTTGWAWIYRYKSPADGRMRQTKIGAWPAISAAAAGAEWEKLRQQRAAGGDPAVERRKAKAQERAASAKRPAAYTVEALLEDYMAAQVRAPKGLAEMRRTLMTGATKILGKLPSEITRSVAFDLINALKATPVQAKSLRRELGAAWEWGHDSGRLSEDVPNWWRQVLRGKLASAGKIVGGSHIGVVKRVLSAQEVGQVIRHLPHMSRLISDLLTLYLWTGCRGAEIVAMEGAEVSQEPDGWWWTIPREKLKMGTHPLATDLRVPLVGRALEVVRSRMDLHGQAHLFPPVQGGAPHVDQKVVGVAVWWHRPTCKLRPESARMRWEIPDWSPHDLRRTVRTTLAALGCPNDVAEAVLGHIQPGVAGVYNRHSYDQERRHWLTQLAQVWEAAAAR